MDILELKNLEKSFDGKKIIDNVSFSVQRGKIVGLLGKNGSGKNDNFENDKRPFNRRSR